MAADGAAAFAIGHLAKVKNIDNIILSAAKNLCKNVLREFFPDSSLRSERPHSFKITDYSLRKLFTGFANAARTL